MVLEVIQQTVASSQHQQPIALERNLENPTAFGSVEARKYCGYRSQLGLGSRY